MIVFTSSGTEANNLALNLFKEQSIIVSEIEHLSVLNCNLHLKTITVNSDGILNMEDLEEKLQYITKLDESNNIAKQKQAKKADSKLKINVLVSVILANNETGALQPLDEISRIVKRYNCYLHSDISQYLGKVPVDSKMLNSLDLMTISSHKLGGPTGVGGLIFRRNLKINPLILGGGQERGMRSGTENVPGIVGFAAVVEMSLKNSRKYANHTKKLRDSLENMISLHCPEAIIASKVAPRLPNTSMIICPNVSSSEQMIRMDLEGICVSNGSACSSGKTAPSHVLAAMGMKQYAKNCLRVSFGYQNTLDEAKKFFHIWKNIYNKYNHGKTSTT
jgi:cysteine desulfurase